MFNNSSPKLKKSMKNYPPMKEEKGTFNMAPASSKNGHISGSPLGSKGFDHAKVIKHDGIVIGGSVTAKKKPASEASINKLPLNKRRIIGSD